jgi:hypothetical protein
VRAAEEPAEQAALANRYQAAMNDAISRNCEAQAREFEAAASTAQVVISRRLYEIDRLATSENQLYATFYQLSEAEVRLPNGEKWDTLRAVADEALFPGYKKQIRFGALSLDGIGLTNYGDCTMVLHENMIAHRTSFFEENSVIFMEKKGVPMAKANVLPRGYRAFWANRGRLCLAKLVGEIHPGTEKKDFAMLLLRNGRKSEDDVFVEAHVFGSVSIRTMERINVRKAARKGQRVFLKALESKLKKMRVTLGEI